MSAISARRGLIEPGAEHEQHRHLVDVVALLD
jgi:hypothetical protein